MPPQRTTPPRALECWVRIVPRNERRRAVGNDRRHPSVVRARNSSALPRREGERGDLHLGRWQHTRLAGPEDEARVHGLCEAFLHGVNALALHQPRDVARPVLDSERVETLAVVETEVNTRLMVAARVGVQLKRDLPSAVVTIGMESKVDLIPDATLAVDVARGEVAVDALVTLRAVRVAVRRS